jgi:spermidine synthase
MHRPELIDTAPIPNGGELRLFREGPHFAIKIAGGGELMHSRTHGSEDKLAEITCTRLASLPAPRVLIGGLGMGFTLAAALKHLGPTAEVVVAELVPGVARTGSDTIFALIPRNCHHPHPTHPIDNPAVSH